MQAGTEARIAFLIYDNQTSSHQPVGTFTSGSHVNDFTHSHQEAKTMVPCRVYSTRHLFHPGSLSSLCTTPCIFRMTTWHTAIAKDYQSHLTTLHTYMHTYIRAHKQREVEMTYPRYPLLAVRPNRAYQGVRQAGWPSTAVP